LHLAGNLSEWTRSEFSTYGVSDEYWIHQGPLWEFTRDKDPEVITDDGKTKLVVRGGSWRDSLQSTWSSLRNSARSAVSVPRPELGFRCVKEFP
jgi:formylglycine-generating enzyme required for sulfatase activity